MKISQRSIRGKVAGYRSAASQARMRQRECEQKGDTEEAERWRAKVKHWEKCAAEWAAKLD